MVKRGGQVALFVIVGLVLLISVSFVFYIAQVITEDQLRQEIQESISDFIQVTSMNQLVESCLEEVTTEGVFLALSQGGVIYDYQGGLTDSSTSNHLPILQTVRDETKELNVSYALLDVGSGSCLNYEWSGQVTNLDDPTQSYYPVRDVPINQFMSTFIGPENVVNRGCLSAQSTANIQKSGFLGYSTLPPLCSFDGVNARGFSSFSRNPCSLEYFDDENSISIQRQVEEYAKTNIRSCVNFTYFEDAGNEITVDYDAVNVSLQLQSPTGVQASAQFPFVVSVRGQQPIVERVSFTTAVPVDFIRLYDYVYDFILKLARDPFFDLEKQWNNESLFSSFQSSFSLDYYEGWCETCAPLSSDFDDVVTITDTNSFIEGDPVQFSFALRQRRPVLDYLHNDLQSSSYLGQPVNFLYFEGELFELSTFAVDPNSDALSFSFQGWKENYDSLLDRECCAQNPLCTLENYKSTSCYQELQTNPSIWSTNFLAQENGGYLSYELTENDIGFHTFTVIVEDEHGARDFQEVSVLVFDSPVASLIGTNNYDDIEDGYASIEDPYTLDASASLASVFLPGDFSNLLYSDSFEGFEFFSDQTILELPLEDYDFSTVAQGEFKKSTFITYGEDEVVDEINVIVRQDQGDTVLESPPATIEVSISECLPHGFLGTENGFIFNSLTHYETPFYSNSILPYYFSYLNEQLSDVEKFNQPHVCCEPLNMEPNMEPPFQGGTYADSSQTCFQQANWYSCFPKPYQLPFYLSGAAVNLEDGTLLPFTEDNYELAGYSVSGVEVYPTDPVEVYDNLDNSLGNPINDVYRIVYDQSCSGTRGNTCSGEISMSWQLVASCNDLNPSINQFARCQGPGVSSLSRPFTRSDSFDCSLNDIYLEYDQVPRCYNFRSFDSFEDNVLSSTDLIDYDSSIRQQIDAGYCAPARRADIDVDGDVSLANGPFTCRATCGSGNCKYHDLAACSCTQSYGADSECNGLSATALFDGDDEVFSCRQNGACLNSCTFVEPQESVEACYCQRTSSGTKSLPSDTSFFFEDSSFESTENSPCCAGSNIIYHDEPTSNVNVCFEGNVGSDRSRFNLNRRNDIVACEGQLYFCAGVDVCVDPSLSQPSGGASCLYVENDGECTIRDVIGGDNDDGTSIPSTWCAQEMPSSVEAILNEEYIADVKGEGAVVCNRRCAAGRWV